MSKPDDWPFKDLTPLTYSMIMADPPWTFRLHSRKGEKKAPQSKYATMSLDHIKALPVSKLARGDALLWLWATHPMLPQAIEVMGAWGFTFKTSGIWVKTTRHGKLGFGTGYVLRSASEPFLIGTIGRPKTAKNVRTVVMAQVREHSRKPDEAYAAAERLAIDAGRRADLFGRETRPGWETWGDQATMFDQPEPDLVAPAMAPVLMGPDERRYAAIKASGKVADAGPLFGGEP